MTGPVKIVTREVEVSLDQQYLRPDLVLDDLPPGARVVAVEWSGIYTLDRVGGPARRATVTLAIEGGLT